MSVASQQSKVIYAGDGITTLFSIPFPLADMVAASDLQVFLVDNLGNVTLLTSGYTPNTATMKVTYPNVGSPLPVGYQLVLNRLEPITQNNTYTDTGPMPAKSVEAALDKLTFICQQLAEQIARAVLVPINTVAQGSPVTPPTVAPVGLVQLNGTWAQGVSYAQANPTSQFLLFVTTGDEAGQWFFYTGNVALGNQGFLGVGG
jgi:hypothetical protein